jgi:hypothetical protein
MNDSLDKPTGSPMKKGCIWLVGIFLGLVVLGAIIGEPEEISDSASSEIASEDTQAGSPTKEDQAESLSDTIEESDALTGPQKNAVRSAKQYLDMTGFSREGLIDQLSSSAGSGYERTDATVAVDSLNVDWNQQAVRSAEQYLEMMGFSCNGLIDQLSSDAGSQYTKSEARYGAEQAGAC